MPAVWVTVAFVNPPKRNPKFGSIKTDEYGYISVPTQSLGEFRKGGRYCIEIEEVGEYKNFIRMSRAQPGGQRQAIQPQQRRGNYPAQPTRQPQRHTAPPPKAPELPFQNDPQARNIFVTGVVGRAMGSGKYESLDILPLTMAAAAAYDQVILGIQPPQLTAEEAFDDDLPPISAYDPQDNHTPVDQDEINY